MKDLLAKELTSFHKINRTGLNVVSESTLEEKFDLSDESEIAIVPYQTGNASFSNPYKEMMVAIHYEQFINQLAGTAFERGRKRCDFLLYDEGTNHNYFILNEQTSTLNTLANLSKSIKNSRTGECLYPGGKYEKVEHQLSETLSTLNEVPALYEFINKYKHKICLMSYLIKKQDSYNEEIPKAKQLFTSRYKEIEARETGEDGALLSCPIINDLGFEYRRISHKYTFSLAI